MSLSRFNSTLSVQRLYEAALKGLEVTNSLCTLSCQLRPVNSQSQSTFTTLRRKRKASRCLSLSARVTSSRETSASFSCASKSIVPCYRSSSRTRGVAPESKPLPCQSSSKCRSRLICRLVSAKRPFLAPMAPSSIEKGRTRVIGPCRRALHSLKATVLPLLRAN